MSTDQIAILTCPSVMVLTGHELETYADLARETIRHEKRWLGC